MVSSLLFIITWHTGGEMGNIPYWSFLCVPSWLLSVVPSPEKWAAIPDLSPGCGEERPGRPHLRSQLTSAWCPTQPVHFSLPPASGHSFYQRRWLPHFSVTNHLSTKRNTPADCLSESTPHRSEEHCSSAHPFCTAADAKGEKKEEGLLAPLFPPPAPHSCSEVSFSKPLNTPASSLS